MPLGGADDAKVDSWWLFETWIFFLCIYSVKGGDDYLITSWANAKEMPRPTNKAAISNQLF